MSTTRRPTRASREAAIVLTGRPDEESRRRGVEEAVRAALPPGVVAAVQARGRGMTAEQCMAAAVSPPPPAPRAAPVPDRVR